eukprot:1155712-Pelagomonas_calceolata.AAC.1
MDVHFGRQGCQPFQTNSRVCKRTCICGHICTYTHARTHTHNTSRPLLLEVRSKGVLVGMLPASNRVCTTCLDTPSSNSGKQGFAKVGMVNACVSARRHAIVNVHTCGQVKLKQGQTKGLQSLHAQLFKRGDRQAPRFISSMQ